MGAAFNLSAQQRVQASRASLVDAYAVLNVSSQASDEEVQKACRRLLSQHHPDKLVAKGLPEEMLKLTLEHTHHIPRPMSRFAIIEVYKLARYQERLVGSGRRDGV